MALPKEPRQKMINIMYLVLTAMLAMNVSAEILNAFDIVNDSIITSNNSIDAKNTVTYNQFTKQAAEDAAKAGPYKAKAETVKKLSADAVSYIENLKNRIIMESDKLDKLPPNAQLVKRDDLDAATRLMENQKEGPKLESMLKKLRVDMLEQVDPKIRTEMSKNLPLNIQVGHAKTGHDDGTPKSWSVYHFNMVPSIAAITILSKFQNDIKNSEAMIIDELLKEIGANDIRFDAMEAFVSMNSKSFTTGQDLEAKIAIGAYSTTVNPDIIVNGQKLEVVNGIATYKMSGLTSLGEHALTGSISLRKPNGELITRQINESYNVGASATAISADKMNVLYIAVQNPISITAAGVPAENVVATIEGGGGRIERVGAGKFMVSVTNPGKAIIKVASNVGGKVTQLDAKEYRVKMIPDPIAMVGLSKSGNVKTAEFKQQQGVRAVLENFEFEGVKYDVMGYRIGIDAKGKDYVDEVASSAYFPGPAMSAIRSLKPGDRVYIENIKVKGPDGKVRDIPYNLTYNLN
ncbi:gliding motility protein GldM [Chitinophaga horti]|uniref:Gliding motility protein GldM n=1 Tax=Chitinophaga horti TaxID=2920382 RepID=A0ABY6J093_9BACT|nr:gliding motility protein GldM [Chitinophaga horti]UYQ93045.1 gliding motility protein GldM [Chitinophaga horti]